MILISRTNRRTRISAVLAMSTAALVLITGCAPQEAVSGGVDGIDADVASALQDEGAIEFTDNMYMESAIQAQLLTTVFNTVGGDASVVTGAIPESLAAMADGAPMVTLDLWRWQYPELWQQYVDEGNGVVELGTTDYTGEEGWYVPTYVIEGDSERGIEPTCPGLPDWEALNDCVDVFKTAKSGDKGQYTQGAEGWAPSYGDDKKIVSLDLDYEIVLAGSEAALFADLTRAYEQGEPWLGLMWRPNYMTLKYDLTRVDFPPYTDECWGDTYACQWPETTIYQVASAEVQENHPTAWGILENYDLNDDQLHTLQGFIVDDGMTTEDAVNQWMEQNPDVWKAWVNS